MESAGIFVGSFLALLPGWPFFYKYEVVPFVAAADAPRAKQTFCFGRLAGRCVLGDEGPGLSSLGLYTKLMSLNKYE